MNLKKDFIWNVLGTGLNAFTSLFYLIAVTRINGLEDAGIFSIAYATACVLYVVGIYAGRVFQVTETNKEIKNKDFIANRFITCLLMIFIVLIFVVIRGYSAYKMTVFIIITSFKMLEAFSDCVYAILQKNNKRQLYYISKMFYMSFFLYCFILYLNVIF